MAKVEMVETAAGPRSRQWVEFWPIARALYDEGRSVRQIEQVIPISEPTISSWLRRAGMLRTKEQQIAQMTASKKGKSLPAHVLRARWTPEARAERSRRNTEMLTRLWKDPEYRARQSAANSATATRRHAEGWPTPHRVSQLELSLIPRMGALGYRHTGDGGFWVHGADGRVRVPDFTDGPNRRVVEIWGRFWHRGQDPQELVDWYREAGWSCSVVWEDEVDRLEELITHQSRKGG